MREEGGRILLMDFGLSTLPHLQKDFAGTPVYMAPELFQGAPASVESDIYAVGALLFFLVTGKHPSGLKRERSGDAADGGERRTDFRRCGSRQGFGCADRGQPGSARSPARSARGIRAGDRYGDPSRSCEALFERGGDVERAFRCAGRAGYEIARATRCRVGSRRGGAMWCWRSFARR